MEEYTELINIISLTMGVAWASGLNLYAVILVLGLGGSTGGIALPENLAIVQDPAVILAAGAMFAVEFFADKIPGVDTGWDALHTFIRIPAGALLAAGTVGDVSPALQLAAGIAGGSVTATTHAAKASTRVMINASPEPFSNWTASITEDVAALGGIWLALNHPVLFLIGLIIFIALLVWLLPKLLRTMVMLFRKLGQFLGLLEPPETVEDEYPQASGNLLEALSKLEAMHNSGSLSDEEFRRAKDTLLAEQASPGS